MKTSEVADQIASRVRTVMQTRAKQVLDHPGVSAVGVAWRRGDLRFVVQTDSIARVGMLKRDLPDTIEGFVLDVELQHLPHTVQGADWVKAQRKERSLARRLKGLLFWRRDWLAFAART